MDAVDLLESLSKDNIDPIIVLVGPERFFADRVVERIREIALRGPMAAFNFRRLTGGETTGTEIVAECRSLPMMADRKIVFVDAADDLKTADFDALDPYLAAPVAETCLVLYAASLDLRRGAISRANRRGQVHRADPLKEDRVAGFIRSRAAAKGVTLSAAAGTALMAAIGTDAAALDDALERLGLFVGPGAQVSERDVAEVVTAVRQHSVFEFVDALGDRDARRALGLAADLMARREEPIRLNALLARHLRQLLVARVHAVRGSDPATLAASLGIPPFAARRVAAQARKLRGADIEAALARVARADLELKSSRRPDHLLFWEEVVDLLMARR